MGLIIKTLVSTIFLFPFACAYNLKNTEAPVHGESKLVNADDYFGSGLHRSSLPVPNYDVSHTVIDASKISALKSIGMTVIRVDFDPSGHIPIHLHPQSSELMTVLEGSLYVGFLIPNPLDRFKSQLVSKILKPGDVFVVPQGHIHFLYNVGNNTSATLLEFYNNLNYYIPTVIPNPIFASDPPINDDMLSKSFRLEKSAIQDLRKKFP